MKREDAAGCFYCIKVFHISKINKYVDDGETPLCPFCGIDAVLEGVICKRVLKRQHQKKFGKVEQLYPKNKYGA